MYDKCLLDYWYVSSLLQIKTLKTKYKIYPKDTLLCYQNNQPIYCDLPVKVLIYTCYPSAINSGTSFPLKSVLLWIMLYEHSAIFPCTQSR